jgi:hypothetical protein
MDCTSDFRCAGVVCVHAYIYACAKTIFTVPLNPVVPAGQGYLRSKKTRAGGQ